MERKYFRITVTIDGLNLVHKCPTSDEACEAIEVLLSRGLWHESKDMLTGKISDIACGKISGYYATEPTGDEFRIDYLTGKYEL